MKKLFLILILEFLFYNLYAQQRDFTFFNHRIDSLTHVYSTKEWQEMIYSNYFDYTDLSEKEKKELIIKVRKLFEQNEYANLYRYGHRIIYDMWWMRPDNNSFETKQILIELYLQYYFYPGTDRIINSYGYDKDRNLYFTEKSKQRLVEILENNKTEEEYKAWLNFEKSLPSSISVSEYLAKELIKKQKIRNDTIIQQIRDSIYTEYVTKDTQKMLESQQIEPDLIRTIGLLDMKECIPILKRNLEENLTTSIQGEPEKSYRYALARLEDKEQRQYILDNFMDIGNFDKEDFLYFKDDGMVWRYIEVNYHSDKRYFPFSHGEGITAGLKTISDIYPLIKNLPDELEHPDFVKSMEAEYKWSESLYEWLMENKESVQFDYDGEKKWFW